MRTIYFATENQGKLREAAQILADTGAEGFEVEVLAKGLGELPSVQALYIERANEAWDKLKE